MVRIHLPPAASHQRTDSLTCIAGSGARLSGSARSALPLCIDRIYNDNLAQEDQLPACVMACPVNARHFGDLGDPDSEVSQMVAQRRGGDLMPELGYRPVNKYLPPRAGRMAPRPPVDEHAAPADDVAPGERLLRWADRLLS